MSTSQCATEPGLADSSLVQSASPQDSPRLLKGVRIGFAATVTIGLALASWYVGVRIVNANEAVPASTVSTTISTSQPAPAPQPPALAGPTAQPVPPPPELYLQVAGLGPRKDAIFVRGLEAKGYRARVIVSTTVSTTESTNQQDSGILIGPFAGPSSLEAAQRKLQSAGVLAIETTY
jgi:hypothetical protein